MSNLILQSTDYKNRSATEVKKMAEANFDYSVAAEAKMLALEYMRQKSLTDDSPEDIAREYRMVEQKIKAALDSLNGVTL